MPALKRKEVMAVCLTDCPICLFVHLKRYIWTLGSIFPWSLNDSLIITTKFPVDYLRV